MQAALSDLLNSHRSIRKYKPDPINPALVDRVLHEAVAGTSSSGNLNSISMVLTTDPERKRRLYELHLEQEMVLQAPLVITFCADWFRTRDWLRRREAADNFDNLVGYHVAAFDAILVSQSACLGFEAAGLGICYMGTTLYTMGEIADFLELPDTCLPVTTIVVGYPDENPTKRDRLPSPALIHHERYQIPTGEDIDAIFAEREVKGWERYMSMPEVREEIEAAGITSLAQFYTSEAKYDPEYFREASETLRKTLEDKHFLP